ncbi:MULTISPECIES: glutamate racemase [Maribacter]|uniref:Glutamate racemase n=1 Tax=Maribacter flavus TaxID=1658664 RepID=A0A5B2TPQ7_9FLAO|nr:MULTISPECIES: glutamate racemase [Maribacter]KAA2215828.1 glutamate racemase [Maribacter flavus]MDC6406382.1 glutamate racemase [Maribacter sp. PR66]MEE1973502.1 glutamate racemase [Maribacter flavus]
MNDNPIGIFDSGIGGTSIWKEIQTLMPYEHCIYLADSKNAPYGEKSNEEILQLSIKNTEYLIQRGCKLIVVACNTATTNAIDYLRNSYDIPFIGIEPAIKPAALNSKSKKVGILATKGTLSSTLFHSTSQNHAAGIEVIERQGKGLVELIEKGDMESDSLKQLLYQFVQPMLEKGIDYLVLGCTHYPYLIPILREILPADVQIIDSGEAVARQTKAILAKQHLQNSFDATGRHQFYTNGNLEVLERFVLNAAKNVTAQYLDF